MTDIRKGLSPEEFKDLIWYWQEHGHDEAAEMVLLGAEAEECIVKIYNIFLKSEKTNHQRLAYWATLKRLEKCWPKKDPYLLLKDPPK